MFLQCLEHKVEFQQCSVGFFAVLPQPKLLVPSEQWSGRNCLGKHPVRLPAPCARRRLVVRNSPDMQLIEGSPLYFHQGKVLAIINHDIDNHQDKWRFFPQTFFPVPTHNDM